MAADLPGPEDMPLDPDLLKTLASDSRRDILRLLKQRRMTLTELATALKLGKATVLEHLKKLQDTGLIQRREDERLWVYYELTPRGKRVVSPGRTRFYIVMAGTALAALLLGVVLTLALTHSNAPAFPPGSPALKGAQPVVAEGTQVVWRGLDPGVTLRFTQDGRPTPGTAFVDGSPYATDASGAVRLDAAALDSLPLGNHTLALLPAQGSAREAVSGFLDVRDPRPVLAPLQVPAGRSASVVLAMADPLAPLPGNVTVDGQPLAVQPAMDGSAFITLRAPAPGTLHVQVGRLALVDVQAVPDVALTLHPDGAGNLTLRVTGPDGAPMVGAGATLAGDALGATDANGTLSFPAPPAGERALRVSTPQGDVTRALRFEGWNVTEAAPQVTLARASGGVFTVLVRNEGSAPQPVTLAAVVDGHLAAARPLDLAPGESQDVTLDVRATQAGPARLEARAPLLSPVAFVNGSLSAPGTPPTAATPATATPTTIQSDQGSAGHEMEYTLDMASVSRILASLDVGVVTTPTSGTPSSTGMATPSPKVPGAEVALVLALVAAAAVASRRRRRER